MTEHSIPDAAEQVPLTPTSLVLEKTSSAGAHSSLVLEKMSSFGIDDPSPLVLE